MKLREKRRMTEKWLLANYRFMNLRALERAIKCPRGILQKYVMYDIKIPEKWIDPLYILIKKIVIFDTLKEVV